VAGESDAAVAAGTHLAEDEGCWQQSSWSHAEAPEEELGEPWYIDAHDLVIEPSDRASHRFTLLVLHSCSGGPDDFMAFFHHLDLPSRSSIRSVVPCSPLRTENHYGWSKEQNSWFEYDNDSKDGNSLKDVDQLLEQRRRILAMLERERQRLPDGNAKRIVLLGLSQGAGLAVDVALHAPYVVGGVVALRGMALSDGGPSSSHGRPSGGPALEVLAINGARDWLCPPDAARATYEALVPYGVQLHFFTEPTLGHAAARGRQKLNKPELRQVSQFISRVWANLPPC